MALEHTSSNALMDFNEMAGYGYYPFPADSTYTVTPAELRQSAIGLPTPSTASSVPSTVFPSGYPYSCYSAVQPVMGSNPTPTASINSAAPIGWPTPSTTPAIKMAQASHHKLAALEAAAVSPILFPGTATTPFDFNFHMTGPTFAPVSRPSVSASRVGPILPTIDTSAGQTTQTQQQPTSAAPSRMYTPIAPHPAGLKELATAAAAGQKHSADELERPSKRQRRPSPPPITTADLSDEDRLLIRLKDDDGLAWKQIAARFQADLGKTYQVPALQMRLKRLRERMRTWSESDVVALHMAYAFWEKHRFDIIAEKMAEFGAKDKWSGKQCARKWESLEEDSPILDTLPMSSDQMFGCSSGYDNQQLINHSPTVHVTDSVPAMCALGLDTVDMYGAMISNSQRLPTPPEQSKLGSPFSGMPTPSFGYATTPESTRMSPVPPQL